MENEATVLTDARGRKLTVKTPGFLEQIRLLRAIGPAQSMNQPYVMMVQAVVSVTFIDGIPCPKPVNERQIDAAIERLGDEGIATIQMHQMMLIRINEAKAEAAMADAAAAAASAEAFGTEVAADDPLAASASS